MPPRALSLLLLTTYVATAFAQAPRIAVIGGGLGGTSAAYFLRELNPTCHLELFEQERIGGRTEELHFGGRILELGASIIHGQNRHVLSLAKAMNLTPTQGDDTDSSFSIYDGNKFVFQQSGSQLRDALTVLKRYGINPLRYKWLAEEMGRRFAGVYDLQQRGEAYTTPQEMLMALGLYNVTQQSAAGYMQDHLAKGLLRFGADRFINELAGAINRINYNQQNHVLNAMAGLVSYLPAAQPAIYFIKEGNALLPDRLAAAAAIKAVHVGTAVQIIRLRSDGRYDLVAAHAAAAAGSSDDLAAASKDTTWQQQQQGETYGPYDAVVLSTPMEGSGIRLEVLPAPQFEVGDRTYQTTVTTFVVGNAVNPKYFSVESMPAGDIFVTDSAETPFTVIADKGPVTPAAAAAAQPPAPAAAAGAAAEIPSNNAAAALDSGHTDQESQKCRSLDSPAVAAAAAAGNNHQQQQQRLWKVFSEEPLTDDLIQQLFINGSVMISKVWKAYPRFHPPEGFAPFLLSPGLCYVNALENAASALEVAAVAAKNCALLLNKQLGARFVDSHAEQSKGDGVDQAVGARVVVS